MITVGELENAHVRLVPMALEHVDALTAAATGDRTTFDLAPVPRDRDAARRYVERALADQAADRAVPFVVFDRGPSNSGDRAGVVVGSYRLMSLEWWSWPDGPIVAPGEPRVVGRDPPDVAEIGHAWLTPAAQRTHVNSSVLYLLMRHAFDVWRVNRLVLKTDARNTRSRNAITRVGGKLEGILRAHSPAANGVIRDTAMFSILPAEWPEHQLRLEASLSGPST